MKKLFILLLFSIVASLTYSQTVVKHGDSLISVKKISVQHKDSTTQYSYYDSKGNKYPVYISTNGKYYAIVTSKNGNQYKKYLKLDN